MLFLVLVVIQLVIFGVLIFLLKNVLTRNVRTATAHLNELNQDYTQKMDEANKRMHEAEKFYDDAILRSKTDAERAKMEILKEARSQDEQIVGDARKQSTEILEQARRARDLMIEEIEQKIEVRAVERASEFLAQILPSEISMDMHTKWTEQILKKGFSDLSRMNFPDGELKVKIISAYELTADQKSQIEEILRTALKREFSLETASDVSLVAGIQVTVASIVIDGTLKFKIREIARRAQRTE